MALTSATGMHQGTRPARREERRRELRRRRLLAASLLLVALIALVAVLIGADAAKHPRASSAKSSSQLAASAPIAEAARSGPPGQQPVPILMYHVIAAPPPGAPFPGLYVNPSEFSEQMHALKAAGWHAVTLDQVRDYWRRGVSLGSGKPIVLSFDNGYQSQYTQALPVLRRLGWVGVENIQLSGLPPSQGGIGPAQVQGLLSAGWELDTQGFSHADLVTLDASQLHYQVAVARQVIRRRYHVPVNWFCYPSGHYNPTVLAAVAAAGYAGSTTVIPGWAHRGDDPYRLARLRVLGGTSGAGLLSLIDGVRHDPVAPVSYGGA